MKLNDQTVWAVLLLFLDIIMIFLMFSFSVIYGRRLSTVWFLMFNYLSIQVRTFVNERCLSLFIPWNQYIRSITIHFYHGFFSISWELHKMMYLSSFLKSIFCLRSNVLKSTLCCHECYTFRVDLMYCVFCIWYLTLKII